MSLLVQTSARLSRASLTQCAGRPLREFYVTSHDSCAEITSASSGQTTLVSLAAKYETHDGSFPERSSRRSTVCSSSTSSVPSVSALLPHPTMRLFWELLQTEHPVLPSHPTSSVSNIILVPQALCPGIDMSSDEPFANPDPPLHRQRRRLGVDLLHYQLFRLCCFEIPLRYGAARTGP